VKTACQIHTISCIIAHYMLLSFWAIHTDFLWHCVGK